MTPSAFPKFEDPGPLIQPCETIQCRRGPWGIWLRSNGYYLYRPQHGQAALLVSGYVLNSRAHFPANNDGVFEGLLQSYKSEGILPVSDLEGSFTVVLFDFEAPQILIYRNIVGSAFTYYIGSDSGFLFSNNLSALTKLSPQPLVQNNKALPAFFYYRYVPGRETLFSGMHRLLPGELLTYDARGLRRSQGQTLGNLSRAGNYVQKPDLQVANAVESVLSDMKKLDPSTANLLSGGVDSSYLQIMLSPESHDQAPRTYSISVDHPFGMEEDRYAVFAANRLGTRHTLVRLENPYITYLLSTMAKTGEPPHHVQTCYFAPIADCMQQHGIKTATCGQGADALFGLGVSVDIERALQIRGLLPSRIFRRVAGKLASVLRKSDFSRYCILADWIYNLEHETHPINTVGAYTDWTLLEQCFGLSDIRRAQAIRRSILDAHEVHGSIVEMVHACDFLSDSIESAGLWANLFHIQGSELRFPFLDSRLLRVAFSVSSEARFPNAQTKPILKRALTERGHAELATRKKLSFAQPIFEWLGPKGQLRSWVDNIPCYDFMTADQLAVARARPNWFLYNLLCYHLWFGLFIERSLPWPEPANITSQWKSDEKT
jgi:asparagine synthase (glutamine-hydrolysing)